MQRHRGYKHNARQGYYERFVVSLFALTLTLSPLNSIAQSEANADPGEPAGRIIFVQGDVAARNSRGIDRPLSRRDEVYVGDTLFTAPGASTQIRMVDDAMISLKESTQFAIIAYEFTENPATDRSSIELIEGGFRTITGTIGEQNRENYEAGIANFATIGIRGTDYEVVITEVGEVFTGVYDGGTTIANDLGSLDLGLDADYDFAFVPDPQSPPQGLLVQPPRLGAVAIRILADDEETEEDDDGDDGGNDAAGGDDADGVADADDADAGDGDAGQAAADVDTDDNAGGDNTAVAGNTATTNGGSTANNTGSGGAGTQADLAALPAPGAGAVADTSNAEQALSLATNQASTNISNSAVSLAAPPTEIVVITPGANNAASALNETQQQNLTSAFTTNPNENNGNGAVNCIASTSCSDISESGQSIVSADTQPDSSEPDDDSGADDDSNTDTGDDDNDGGDESNIDTGDDGNDGGDESTDTANPGSSDSDVNSGSSGGAADGNTGGDDSNDSDDAANSDDDDSSSGSTDSDSGDDTDDDSNTAGGNGNGAGGNGNGNNGVGNGNGGSNGSNDNAGGNGNGNSGNGNGNGGSNNDSDDDDDDGSDNNGNGNGNSNSNGNNNSSGNGNGNSGSDDEDDDDSSNSGNGNGNSNSNGSSNSNGNGNGNSSSDDEDDDDDGSDNNGNGNGNSNSNGSSNSSGNGNGNSSSDDEDDDDDDDSDNNGNGNNNGGGNGNGGGNSGNGGGNNSDSVILDASDVNFQTLSVFQRFVLNQLGINANSTQVTVDESALSDIIVATLGQIGVSVVGSVSGLVMAESDTTVESYAINWGSWDNPVDQNWVVVQQVNDELVRISTDNYFAELSPTPIANMTGSHNYRTGIASTFIGHGSGGDISNLTAGMDVNFDTGEISNGTLQVLAGNQAWSVDFDGLVQHGMVELNPLGGQLIDPTGVLSNQLEIDLGGAFTGQHAEAFVGGFEMLDAINELNHVEGLFTLER